jgi:hypothetical protein
LLESVLSKKDIQVARPNYEADLNAPERVEEEEEEEEKGKQSVAKADNDDDRNSST